MSYWWFGVSNWGTPPTYDCVSVPICWSPASVSLPDASVATVRWCGFAVEV
jgi:hypothetical protein